MTTPEPERTVRNWLPMFSKPASFTVVVIGILVLIGWALDLRFLTCLAPGCVAMNPMAAVGLVLSGVGLWLAARRQKSASARGDAVGIILAAAIAVLGAARLAQYLGAFDFQVDQLLFAGKLRGIYPPCELAPITALGFIFCGLALLLFDVESLPRLFPSTSVHSGHRTTRITWSN